MIRSTDEVLDTLDLSGDAQVDRKRIVLRPGNWETFDPFLMMAEDWFTQPGFDWHPHRGIETVTFVLSGRQRHGDSTGSSSVLEPGDAQWMTAGRGIIHQELADGDDEVHSLQLWLNLPSAHKLTQPRWQNLRRDDVTRRRIDDALVHVYAGPGSDTETVQPVSLLDIELPAGGSTVITVGADWRAIGYVLAGEVDIGAARVEDGQVAISHPGGGDEIRITAHSDARVLLFSGLPIREPVVQRGPFVMNTVEEIDQAIDDHRSGRLAPWPA